MLLNNPIIIENKDGKEIDCFNALGNPMDYPVSYFAPFKGKDAFAMDDDMVGFKVNIHEALENMKEAASKLNGAEKDKSYGINIKENIISMIKSIKNENYPEDYTVVMYYGKMADVMTLQDLEKMIPEMLNH